MLPSDTEEKALKCKFEEVDVSYAYILSSNNCNYSGVYCSTRAIACPVLSAANRLLNIGGLYLDAAITC